MGIKETQVPQVTLDALDALWLKMRSVEAVTDRQWRLSLDFLRYHLVFIVISGQAQVVADGRHYALHAAQAFVCRPGQLVKAAVGSEEAPSLYVFHFDAKSDSPHQDKLVSPAAPMASILPLNGSIPLSDLGWIGANCMSAALHWHSEESLQRLQAQSLFYSIVCRILQDSLYIQADKDLEDAIGRTKQYMDLHFERNITIDELAEMAGLSRFYYMRSFKQTYGQSAMDYLLALRIDHSKHLMEKTDIRLRDIARQVGYSDEYYFIRKFKQKVGIPPGTYMRNRQRRIAAYSFPNIGQLLSLQIVPHAAPMDHSWTDLYRKKYDSDVVVKLSHDYEFNLEALRKAHPDYIIGVDHFIPAAEQRKLEQIAPTFLVPWLSHDWREHLRLTADFLGNEAEAAAWLADYEHKSADVREQVGRIVLEQTVLVLQVHNDKLYVYGDRTIAGVLYRDLQLSPPPGACHIASYEAITLERLSELDADRILLMFSDGSNPRQVWDKLRKSETWSHLRAVIHQRVTLIPPCLWFEYSGYTQEKFLNEVPGIFKA